MAQPTVFNITGLVSQKHASAKLALPVDRAAILYSRYKHVRGTNPLGQTNGVPLSKLRALDNLIERLMRLRSNKPLVKQTADLTDNELNGLMESYLKGLHSAVSNTTISASIAGEFNQIGMGSTAAVTLDVVA